MFERHEYFPFLVDAYLPSLSTGILGGGAVQECFGKVFSYATHTGITLLHLFGSFWNMCTEICICLYMHIRVTIVISHERFVLEGLGDKANKSFFSRL